jgi:hypothetical protein
MPVSRGCEPAGRLAGRPTAHGGIEQRVPRVARVLCSIVVAHPRGFLTRPDAGELLVGQRDEGLLGAVELGQGAGASRQ